MFATFFNRIKKFKSNLKGAAVNDKPFVNRLRIPAENGMPMTRARLGFAASCKIVAPLQDLRRRVLKRLFPVRHAEGES